MPEERSLNHALREEIELIIDQRVSERVSQEVEAILRQRDQENNRVCIVVFSGDMDKLLAAFIIATGAVSMGLEVSMYFTFWGLVALKKKKKKTVYKGKSIYDKMMAMMLPNTIASISTSKMNMLGMGPAFFKKVMKDKNVESLPNLIDLARELEVKMVACQMAMDVMGITQEELIDGLDYGGVATYLADAAHSKVTLFI